MADILPNSESSSHYLNNFATFNRRGRLNFQFELFAVSRLCPQFFLVRISAFFAAEGSSLLLERGVILKVAELAKGQYRAHVELPSGLSHLAQFGEIYAPTIIQAAAANMYVRNTRFVRLFTGQ
jgi:hypothetical protein